MNELKWAAVAVAVGAAGVAWADDDEDEREEGEHGARGPQVAPVTDAIWRDECGSCHFAYPPGLLPARSWVVLLDGLGDHFGDVATVAPATLAHLKSVAAAGAADRATAPLSARLAAATRGTTPTRISQIPWLAAEHREEVPAALVTANPKVKTWAACAACHPDAAVGRFDEGRVSIPR